MDCVRLWDEKAVSCGRDSSNRAIGTSRLLRRTPADVKIMDRAEPQRGRRTWDRCAHLRADNGCDFHAGGHSGNATNSNRWCEESWLIPPDTITRTCGKSQ